MQTNVNKYEGNNELRRGGCSSSNGCRLCRRLQAGSSYGGGAQANKWYMKASGASSLVSVKASSAPESAEIAIGCIGWRKAAVWRNGRNGVYRRRGMQMARDIRLACRGDKWQA